MKKSPIFSIIIPVRIYTPYLRETLSHLKKQTFNSFETLVLQKYPDQLIRHLTQSRHQMSQVVFSFLDDDSYPSPNWLKTLSAIDQ